MTLGVSELLELAGDAERLRVDVAQLAKATDPVGKTVGVPLATALHALEDAEDAIALELGRVLLGERRTTRA